MRTGENRNSLPPDPRNDDRVPSNEPNSPLPSHPFGSHPRRHLSPRFPLASFLGAQPGLECKAHLPLIIRAQTTREPLEDAFPGDSSFLGQAPMTSRDAPMLRGCEEACHFSATTLARTPHSSRLFPIIVIPHNNICRSFVFFLLLFNARGASRTYPSSATFSVCYVSLSLYRGLPGNRRIKSSGPRRAS
jgi:hypothetical protein